MADINDGNNKGDVNVVTKDIDKAGTYSDDLLRLVEEHGKDGVSYVVECCKTGDLLYSSISKPQAFSFAEGYRARDNSDNTSKTTKSKEDDDNDGKAKIGPNVDPSAISGQAKVARKRMVF
jgi:hypothetical protein